MTRFRRSTISAALLVTAALLVGCSGNPGTKNPTAVESRTLTIAANVDSNTLDPAQLTGGNQDPYWQPVHDTLLALDTDAKVQPNLAESWKYDETLTTLTFTIQHDLLFADGSPINAKAIMANLQRLKAAGPNAYMMAQVDSMEAPDATTLVVHFAKPDPGFLGYMSVMGGAIGNPANFNDPDFALNGGQSSGPYVLDEGQTQRGQRYVYTRNKNFWNPKAFPFDTYVVVPMEDVSARLNALKSGQIDSALLEAKQVSEAKSSGLEVTTAWLDWVGLAITDREGELTPALADVRVRQAINYAIDAEGILKNVQLGMGERSTQIFNAQSDAFVKDLNNRYPYDPAKARALLAEAGYADGFELVMPRATQFEDQAPFIEQNLAAVGITVRWDIIQAGEYYAEGKKPRWSAVWLQMASQEPWRVITKTVDLGSSWNTFNKMDPELGTLIEEARVASEADRPALLQHINSWLVENAWFAPWYFRHTIIVTNPKTVHVVAQPWQVAPAPWNYTPAG